MNDVVKVTEVAKQNREHAIKTASLEMAIRSNCGLKYDEEGREMHNAEETVKAAKLFEAYIKGTEPMNAEEFVKRSTKPLTPNTPNRESW